jgi:tRNA(Ile)-lysidine synthase
MWRDKSKISSSEIISPEQIISSIPSNSTILVGFSGGPDSVCLLHLLNSVKADLNLKIIAVHLDHGWRSESKQDALWCKFFCEKLGIQYISKTAQELNFQPKYNGSKEDLGRKLRRYFFEEIAHQYNAQAIALAHHQDDQIETFFIRLLRGSSVSGLSCMKKQDGIYLRPLLEYTKKDILQYLKRHKLDYVTDSTNQEKNFLRNRIRLDLMPTLSTIDSRWQTTIPNSIKQLQLADEFIHKQSLRIRSEIAHPDNFNNLNIEMFLEEDSIIQYKILLTLLIEQKATFTPSHAFFEEIIRFLRNNRSSSHKIFEKYEILKKHGFFYLVQI